MFSQGWRTLGKAESDRATTERGGTKEQTDSFHTMQTHREGEGEGEGGRKEKNIERGGKRSN